MKKKQGWLDPLKLCDLNTECFRSARDFLNTPRSQKEERSEDPWNGSLVWIDEWNKKFQSKRRRRRRRRKETKTKLSFGAPLSITDFPLFVFSKAKMLLHCPGQHCRFFHDLLAKVVFVILSALSVFHASFLLQILGCRTDGHYMLAKVVYHSAQMPTSMPIK